MNSKRKLIQNLSDRKRVRLLPKNYISRVKVILFSLIIVVATLNTFLLFSTRITFLNLGIAVTSALLSLGFYLYCQQKIKATVLKGDTLIVKSMNKSSKVASLRSIKSVKTKSMLGLQYTHLSYSLDGRTEEAMFVGKSSYLPFSPENTIKEAVKLSKKRKANHKPGPVSVN